MKYVLTVGSLPVFLFQSSVSGIDSRIFKAVYPISYSFVSKTISFNGRGEHGQQPEMTLVKVFPA